MIYEQDGKMRTEKGEIRAILVDTKFICTECYRLTDPHFERISEYADLTDSDIDATPKSVRSLLYFCDGCKKVFAHPGVAFNLPLRVIALLERMPDETDQ
jgi:hypothetical protein